MNYTAKSIAGVMLMSCFLSCQKAELSDRHESVMSFSASFEDSKVARDAEGKSVWETGDQIDIFYDGGSCPATADKAGATTTFTTDAAIPADKSLYVAVYPSQMMNPGFDAELVDGELKVTLKESSSAGTFATCAICKASTTIAGGSLSFSNIGSMLKYSSSNNKVTESSLYLDGSIRRTSLTAGAGESVYYSTLAIGGSTGSEHVNELGLRLTSRSTGVDYPAYNKTVNRDFVNSHIYNIGNVEGKVFKDVADGEITSLRLMSFNILRGDLQGPSHLWSTRKDACLAMLAADKPDIINLQECTPVQRRDILDKFLKYGAIGLCVNGKLEDVNDVSSNTIIYNGDKLLVEDYGHYWFSDTPSKANSYTWNTKKPRNLVWARFKIKGSNRRFICISMHLQNDGDLYYADWTKITDADDLNTYGEENRVKSVNLILEKVLPAINPGSLPIILSGDCNSLLSSAALTKLQTVLTPAVNLAPAGNSDSGNTFNAFIAAGKSAIDHIFSKNCTHTSYRVDRNSYSGVYVSDHWPVYTDFTIPEPPCFDSSLEGWTQDDINTSL